jgi:hypothetical protein
MKGRTEIINCLVCNNQKVVQKYRHQKFCSRKCSNSRPNSSRFSEGVSYEQRYGKVLSEKLKEDARERGKKSYKLKTKFSMKGRKQTEEAKSKIGLKNAISLKGRKMPKETTFKIIKNSGKSSFEKRFEDVLQKNKLPYIFVGDGKFFIDNLCPDFINCNGHKIAVELFYSYHKNQHEGGVDGWKLKRKQTFEKYGWNIEFFDETQLNEEEIVKRLRID